MLYGNAWERYEAPTYVELGLELLGELIREMDLAPDSPASNSGAEFANDVFVMRAYYWGDEDDPRGELPNFEYGDISIHWYKCSARDCTTNRPIYAKEWAGVMLRCIRSLGQERN